MERWNTVDVWMENRPTRKSVQGQIVDVTCYVEHAGFGSMHRECAERCAKAGLPLGFAVPEGDVYLFSGPGHLPLADVNKPLLPFVETTVHVSGYFFEQHPMKLLAAEKVETAPAQHTTEELAALYERSRARSKGRDDGQTVIRDVATAMGGATTIRRVEDVVLESSMILSSGQSDHRGDARTDIRYPDKIRSALRLPSSGPVIQGYDGRSAWLQADAQIVDLPPTMGDEMGRLVFVTAGLGLVREALEARAEVELAQQTSPRGLAVEWRRQADRVLLVIDPATHLLSSAAYRAISPQGSADVEVLWSDYRAVDGITVPWRTIVYRNERKYSDSNLKSIRFNAHPLPSVFVKPAAPGPSTP